MKEQWKYADYVRQFARNAQMNAVNMMTSIVKNAQKHVKIALKNVGICNKSESCLASFSGMLGRISYNGYGTDRCGRQVIKLIKQRGCSNHVSSVEELGTSSFR